MEIQWLNIYGDSKSVTKALGEIEVNGQRLAEPEDMPAIRVAICNSFHRKGRAWFTTKLTINEGSKVCLITREEDKQPTYKVPRNIKVTTYRDNNILGVLRVSEGKGYLDFLYMDSCEPIIKQTPQLILDKVIKFCNKHNIEIQ